MLQLCVMCSYHSATKVLLLKRDKHAVSVGQREWFDLHKLVNTHTAACWAYSGSDLVLDTDSSAQLCIPALALTSAYHKSRNSLLETNQQGGIERWSEKTSDNAVTPQRYPSGSHIHYWCLRLSSQLSAFYYLCLKQLVVYTQRSYSLWESGWERASKRRVVGLTISMATCIIEKKKKCFFQCGRQSFITQKENCSTHKRPQRARQHLSGDLNNRATESVAYLLIMYPLTSTLQLHLL